MGQFSCEQVKFLNNVVKLANSEHAISWSKVLDHVSHIFVELEELQTPSLLITHTVHCFKLKQLSDDKEGIYYYTRISLCCAVAHGAPTFQNPAV